MIKPTVILDMKNRLNHGELETPMKQLTENIHDILLPNRIVEVFIDQFYLQLNIFPLLLTIVITLIIYL